MNNVRIKLLACTMCAVFMVGCGSSYGGNYASTEAATYDYSVPASAEYTSEESFGSGDFDNSTIKDTSRKLITRISLSAETKDFDTSIRTIRQQVSALNGYVESSDVSNNSYYNNTSSRYASYTIRIPENKISDFMGAVEGVCNITNSSESVEDVTLNYTDTSAHIKVLKTEQDYLFNMLESCTTVEDMMSVEKRISEVTYELESYESTLRTYDNLLSYSTINITISEVKELTIVEEEPETVWDRIAKGFSDNIKNISTFFVNLFVGIVIALPYLVLFAIIGFIVYLCVKSYRKKHKNDEKKNATPAEKPVKNNVPYTVNYTNSNTKDSSRDSNESKDESSDK